MDMIENRTNFYETVYSYGPYVRISVPYDITLAS